MIWKKSEGWDPLTHPPVLVVGPTKTPRPIILAKDVVGGGTLNRILAPKFNFPERLGLRPRPRRRRPPAPAAPRHGPTAPARPRTWDPRPAQARAPVRRARGPPPRPAAAAAAAARGGPRNPLAAGAAAARGGPRTPWRKQLGDYGTAVGQRLPVKGKKPNPNPEPNP